MGHSAHDLPVGLLGPDCFPRRVGPLFLVSCPAFILSLLSHGRLLRGRRKLVFLKEHPLVCGLFFGRAVEEVMNLIVLPLSRAQSRGLTNFMT